MKFQSHKNAPFRKNALAIACAVALGSSFSSVAFAQESDTADAESDEKIIVTGTRVSGRSANDSPVPVDVISGEELRSNSSSDLQDMIRTTVPSFNINTQPISDAATIVRPANLRGLSPDNVLVLVNGKRRHRGSIISFLGGGISDGAQGVDISAIPSMALERVEVLRDGASSQYGSDAIAGVMNFILRDDSEGFEANIKWGETSEGDGDNLIVSANAGFELGSSGFLNVTAEIKEVDGTVRGVVRDDVQGLIDGGYYDSSLRFSDINAYTDQIPQYWGQPDVEDDIKLFYNSAVELDEKTELYSFGNFGQRTVSGGFFFRNPLTRGGVYRGPLVDPATGMQTSDTNIGVASVLVGDLDGQSSGGSCIDGIPINGVIPDATFLAQVVADPNCFSFLETIPLGFVPRFGGDNEDMGFTVGVRGDLDIGSGLAYDVSFSTGSNRTDFFIMNTINASLGPNTPRDFIPGGQEQTETMFNADFVYAVDVGLVSDLSIAFGTEYREEEFDLFAGDPASYQLGPLAFDQNVQFSSSSNGFGGFPNDTSASQDSTAFYVDVEADFTDDLTLQAAVRTEDFSEFGRTTDYKLAGIYHVTEDFKLRFATSTGFHAPTAGQANITNVTTQNVGGQLVDQGTLPLSSAAGQLAADFIASAGNGRPELGPEEAENVSFGASFKVLESEWTIDFYKIEVEDRVALGANVDFLSALNFAGGGANYSSVADGLTQLDAAGVINRQDFLGLDDLAEFRFFSNSFDTTTEGIDLVGNYNFDLWGGNSRIVAAFNYNKTDVTNRGDLNPIGEGRVSALEDLLPKYKGVVSWVHTQGDFRTMVRGNYYGEWDDTGNGFDDKDAEILIDVEVTYFMNENIELILGIQNLFDTYPEENPASGSIGQLYPEASPFGFNGTEYYLQARYTY